MRGSFDERAIQLLGKLNAWEGKVRLTSGKREERSLALDALSRHFGSNKKRFTP